MDASTNQQLELLRAYNIINYNFCHEDLHLRCCRGPRSTYECLIFGDAYYKKNMNKVVNNVERISGKFFRGNLNEAISSVEIDVT